MKKIKTGGRKAGTPNKTTKELKEMFQIFFENNVDKLQLWFDEVSNDNPAQAIELFLKLSKFILPEESKTESDKFMLYQPIKGITFDEC